MKYALLAALAAVVFVPAAYADHPVPSLAQVADIVFGTTVTVSSGTHIVANQITPTQFLINADGTSSLRPSSLTVSVSISHNTDVGTVVRTADVFGEFRTAPWVRPIADAWLSGDITDAVFLEGMQFAVSHGAVRIDVSDSPDIVRLVDELGCKFVSSTITRCDFIESVGAYGGILNSHAEYRQHVRDYQKIIDLHAGIASMNTQIDSLRPVYQELLGRQ